MSLGVDTTGSDNGYNEIGNSGNAGRNSGSSMTDHCNDNNNNHNRTDADKFQAELGNSFYNCSSIPGSYCSLSDLYSGTLKTTSP